MITVHVKTDAEQKSVTYQFTIGTPDHVYEGVPCHAFSPDVKTPWLVQTLDWLGLKKIGRSDDEQGYPVEYWAER